LFKVTVIKSTPSTFAARRAAPHAHGRAARLEKAIVTLRKEDKSASLTGAILCQ